MLRPMLLALFVLCVCNAAQAQDPVKVDAKHYKVEFENSQVRVLRITYGPHEKSVMHRHPNSVAAFVTDANGTFNFPKGPAQPISAKAGTTQWNAATTHLPENTSDQAFEVILVELKSKPVKKAPPKSSTTSTAPKP